MTGTPRQILTVCTSTAVLGCVFEALNREQWGSCAGLCLKWNI